MKVVCKNIDLAKSAVNNEGSNYYIVKFEPVSPEAKKSVRHIILHVTGKHDYSVGAEYTFDVK